MVLPFLKLFLLARKAKQAHNGTTQAPKAPMSKTNKLRLLAVIPVIITAIALLLSNLKPGFMSGSAVFTLNTTRIGAPVLESLDNKIMAIHFKRAEPSEMLSPTITAMPTTLITMAPRGLGSALSSLTADAGSDIDSLTAGAGSAVHSASSIVHSKASSIESVVSSKATSALGAAQTSIIKAVNNAYHDAINELELKGFYAIHISATCEGTYQFKNGTNMTVGDSGLPTKGTHMVVDRCSSHSVIDPMQLIRIVYWIGIVLTAISFILAVGGLVRPTRKMALLNIFGTIPAFIVILLASSVTHGIAVGAEHLVNFLGSHIGVEGKSGAKFLQLTWATVILLLIDMIFWGLLFFLSGRNAAPQRAPSGLGWSRKRPDRTSAILLGQISQPQQAHIDRNGHAMI
ncbi:hypothetical protein LTR56_018000 [Elasticomyces elasticus]|nr:hypothetical protein LTR56_018000 [Elasticomyces elasticus]KAK3663335.1 hypothetical protein LTR22_005742 [Elasticomyces elasticus]KAK4925414.1 hypothetical protein LTR49_007478 [Elasticomyces elasticus]KAK5764509.1 hypothetical protein LTS12_005239 [Elasticomyces elasticus]